MYYDVWYNVNIFYSKRQKKQDYAAQRVDGESAELTLIRFRLTENMVCWWFLTWKSSDKKDVYNSIQHITKQQQQKQQTKPHINFVVLLLFFSLAIMAAFVRFNAVMLFFSPSDAVWFRETQTNKIQNCRFWIE